MFYDLRQEHQVSNNNINNHFYQFCFQRTVVTQSTDKLYCTQNKVEKFAQWRAFWVSF